MKSPARAPTYTLYKTVTAAESGPYVTKSKGINTGVYKYAHIQVVPSTGDTPTIKVYYWSEGGQKFVRTQPATAPTVGASAEAYEFTVECMGRIMFVAVEGTIALSTKIYVSGFNDDGV